MVLGKLPMPGRPTILIIVGQGPIALAVGAGVGLFGHFYSPLSFLFFFSLSLGDGLIWTEILSKRAAKPKTTTTKQNFAVVPQYYVMSACLWSLAVCDHWNICPFCNSIRQTALYVRLSG